ncbi:MAG TPA: hydrolase [Janthinobacterium sp.]|nr:hydrolase [Janthinobacterium sp.]
MEEQLVSIEGDAVHMDGALELPDMPIGVVLFAYGSDRLNPGNGEILAELRHAGMGTLLLDLLSAEEEKDYYTRFDMTLLTQRLAKAADCLAQSERTRGLPLGLFGSGSGAAAALQLAAWRGADIAAVVTRGGRPDLAGRQTLDKVRAPTLLIVGGLDNDILDLNRMAFTALHCDKQLEVINGASSQFGEAGALQAAAVLARSWFTQHFSGRA